MSYSAQKTYSSLDNLPATEINNITSEVHKLATFSEAKVLIFGDSVTETLNTEGGIRDNWPSYAMPYLGITNYTNYAKSGAAYRDRVGVTDWQKVTYQLFQASGQTDVNIVIFSAGTNDGVTNLGSYTTAMSKSLITDLDKSLLYEALRFIYWQARIYWPQAIIYTILPIQRADIEMNTVVDMYNAIKLMAGRYGIIVIDAANESGIVKDLEVWQAQGQDLYDGLHPSITGRKKMAKLIAKKITSTYTVI